LESRCKGALISSGSELYNCAATLSVRSDKEIAAAIKGQSTNADEAGGKSALVSGGSEFENRAAAQSDT
jgi:hypothetical protein